MQESHYDLTLPGPIGWLSGQERRLLSVKHSALGAPFEALLPPQNIRFGLRARLTLSSARLYASESSVQPVPVKLL